MKRFSFIFLGVLFFGTLSTSCQRQMTQEGKIKRTFIEYVKTDFGDPSTFVEVTKIEPNDSMSAKPIIAMLDSMSAFKVVMTSSLLKQYDKYYKELKADTNNIKTYKIKVRVRLGKDKKELGMKDFYYVDENGKERIQDHALKVNELPQLYQDAYDYIEAVLDYSTSLRMSIGNFSE